MAKSPEIAAFGMAVRRRRQMRRVTQSALARLCGVSVSQMCNIESGLNYPSLPIYFKVCTVLATKPPPFSPH